MKIYSIKTTGPVKVTPEGNRIYKLSDPFGISIYTDEGKYSLWFNAGFFTNFRSGGLLVDPFVDQIGDEEKAKLYLFHDGVYTPCDACGGDHPLSRKKGDEILKEGLIYLGMSKFKAGLVYTSVRAFGNSAYWEDDELTSTNRKLFSFSWESK